MAHASSALLAVLPAGRLTVALVDRPSVIGGRRNYDVELRSPRHWAAPLTSKKASRQRYSPPRAAALPAGDLRAALARERVGDCISAINLEIYDLRQAARPFFINRCELLRRDVLLKPRARGVKDPARCRRARAKGVEPRACAMTSV